MLLPPLKDPVSPPLAAWDRVILGLLAAVSPAEALDLACRALVGVLRPAPVRGLPRGSALPQHPLSRGRAVGEAGDEAASVPRPRRRVIG